jgi:hypothetical protein
VTSDAAVVLGVTAAGLFFGLLFAILLREVFGVVRIGRWFVASVLAAAAAAAWGVWSLMGYHAVAGAGQPQQDPRPTTATDIGRADMVALRLDRPRVAATYVPAARSGPDRQI